MREFVVVTDNVTMRLFADVMGVTDDGCITFWSYDRGLVATVPEDALIVECAQAQRCKQYIIQQKERGRKL